MDRCYHRMLIPVRNRLIQLISPTFQVNPFLGQHALPLFKLDDNTTLISHSIHSDSNRNDELLLNQTFLSLSLEFRPNSPLDASSSPPDSPPSAEADAEDVQDSNRCQITLKLSTRVTPSANCVTLPVPRSPRNTLSFKQSTLSTADYHLTVVPPLQTKDDSEKKGSFAPTDTLTLAWTTVAEERDSQLVVAHHSLEVEYHLDETNVQVVAKGRCEGVQVGRSIRGGSWMELVVAATSIEQLSVIGESISSFEIVDSSLPSLPTRSSTSTSSRSGSPSKPPPSPSPLRLYPKPSSLLHDFQVRPPLRYSSRPDSYTSLFDTIAPSTPALDEDAPSLLRQEAPFLRGSPSRSNLGSDLLGESVEDTRSDMSAQSSLVNALKGGPSNRSETRIRIYATPTVPIITSPVIDFDYTVSFSIAAIQLAVPAQGRRSFRIPSLSIPAATSEIVTATVGGGDDAAEVEVEAASMEPIYNETGWNVSPLPSTRGVKWSRSRSQVVAEGQERDARVELKKVEAEGDSTIIADELEVESQGSPSPRRTRTDSDSLPSLPPPLSRFDSTFTVLDTPFTVPSASPFAPHSLSDVVESIAIDPITARSILAPDAPSFPNLRSQIPPISTTPPLQLQDDSPASEPRTESLLAPVESDLPLQSTSPSEPTMLRSARLSIITSDTLHAVETGYALALSHQVELAEEERRLEITIGKRLQLDISAWTSDGGRVQLKVDQGDIEKDERIVGVTWTELVKEFIFSVSLAEKRLLPSRYQTRGMEERGELSGGLRSMRLGFAVAILEIDINPRSSFTSRSFQTPTDTSWHTDYQRVSGISPQARSSNMMFSPTSQLDFDGLRRFHLPRMSTISLKIEPTPARSSGIVAQSFANGWRRFTLLNIGLVIYGFVLFAYMMGLLTPNNNGGQRPLRKCTNNPINSTFPTTFQNVTFLPQPTPNVSNPTPHAPAIDSAKNGLIVANGELSKLTEVLRQGAVRLYDEVERTLYNLLAWLGLRRGR